MFPHFCSLKPWVGENRVFYPIPTPPYPHQLATVYVGSHGSQTTEAAAPKPQRHLQDRKELNK